jgi:hypothetical protein
LCIKTGFFKKLKYPTDPKVKIISQIFEKYYHVNVKDEPNVTEDINISVVPRK